MSTFSPQLALGCSHLLFYIYFQHVQSMMFPERSIHYQPTSIQIHAKLHCRSVHFVDHYDN